MDLDSQLIQLSGGLKLLPVDMLAKLFKHPKKKYPTRTKIDMIVVHCTDRDWTIDQLNEYDVLGKLTYIRPFDGQKVTEVNHISKDGVPQITYHYCITNDTIYHTLEENKASYHAAGYNKSSLAVSMVYRTTNPVTNQAEFKPPENMIKLTQCHVAELCLRLGLTPDKVFGHRELEGTGWNWIKGRKRLLKTCPGPFVDLDLMRLNIAKYMQVKMKLAGCYPGKVDGLFGPQSNAAFKLYLLRKEKGQC